MNRWTDGGDNNIPFAFFFKKRGDNDVMTWRAASMWLLVFLSFPQVGTGM